MCCCTDQIAAKIGGASVPAGQAGDPLGGGLKRPLEDFSGEEPDRKKNMAFQSMNDRKLLAYSILRV